jgi:hypothetical protein
MFGLASFYRCPDRTTDSPYVHIEKTTNLRHWRRGIS